MLLAVEESDGRRAGQLFGRLRLIELLEERCERIIDRGLAGPVSRVALAVQPWMAHDNPSRPIAACPRIR